MTVTEHKDILQKQLTDLRGRLTDGRAAITQMEAQMYRLEGAIAICEALQQEAAPVVPPPEANGHAKDDVATDE